MTVLSHFLRSHAAHARGRGRLDADAFEMDLLFSAQYSRLSGASSGASWSCHVPTLLVITAAPFDFPHKNILDSLLALGSLGREDYTTQNQWYFVVLEHS